MNQALESVVSYFKGVKTEWSKITWPEKNQVIFETISVIVIVFVFTVAIYLVDLLFRFLLDFIK
ncbi:MAG: preprotein translocase subunit SecE [Candidatus Gastranaerophilaceae bacterium]